MTKASLGLYVYYGPVAVLVRRRFDHTPVGVMVRVIRVVMVKNRVKFSLACNWLDR